MTAAVGESWRASLALHWSLTETRSTLVGNRHEGPLRVQKPFYPEGGVAHAVVLHPPGGIAGGDDLAIDIRVDPGAHALHTTPGATKWYKADGRPARQAIQATVGDGGVLEWLPQENIVFDRAQATLSTSVDLSPGAVFLGWDVVCLGRRASGEHFSQGTLRLDGLVTRAGRPLWAERALLAADDLLIASPLGLAGGRVFATVVAAGRIVPPDVLDACRAVPTSEPDRSGTSVIDDLLVARWIGASSSAARAWCEALWQCLRPAVCGREACPPRVWAT